MDKQQLEQLYGRLDELIKERNHGHVVVICDQILAKKPTDTRVAKCRLVALLKSDKLQQLTTEYSTKGVPTPSDTDEQQHLQYGYYLYCSEKYEECLKFVQSNSFQTLPFLLLSAQSQNKLNKFADSTVEYLSILKKFPKADDYADILVNAMASAIQSAENNAQDQVRQVAANYAKNNKTAQQNREFVYNYGCLLGCLREREQSVDWHNKFKQMVTGSEGDKQDEAIAAVQHDFNDFNDNKMLVGESLEQKIKEYEDFLKLQLTDKNLKAVLSNNYVGLRIMNKQEHNGDYIKFLDDAISGKNKQTPEQLAIFKLNKILLLVHRAKPLEALAIISELEKSYINNQPAPQVLGITYLTIKAFTLLKTKKEEQLAQFIDQLQNEGLLNKNISLQHRVQCFLLLAEIARTQSQQFPILNYFELLVDTKIAEELQQIFENEAICCFVLSVISKIKEDTPSPLIQGILEKIAANTHSPLILQYLGDIYSKSNAIIAVQIYTKLSEQFPKESSYQQRLAKIHSAAGDFQKAQALLQNIKFNLIEDYTELSKLESEIALSKIDTKQLNTGQQPQVQKKIVKLKKRVRYPKNFDPKNPGPPPNPERWLPKWERKDFKKKKGAAFNSRTQGSSAAASDHTSTTKTFTSANSTSHKSATKNKKTNKKKRN